MSLKSMIAAHPHVDGHVNDPLEAAIEAARDCAVICAACADACIGESNPGEMAQCIRTDLDCADICAATATVALRRTGSNEGVIRAMLETCAAACAAGAAE